MYLIKYYIISIICKVLRNLIIAEKKEINNEILQAKLD